ncbi:phosphoribosylformylglycinamidine cyclo-ligase [Metallosphaera tengchongensis]|uniref:phosphoribosylformylglycinamidine cyclo-ligase n=1 Tax=Metallosphaera tengchongensis TaxID=1532350 RepID=A0A6N0P0Q7_9CREN|nr:phosphoribosylformylglycinamidine cyclo-ligase [Metallosphaera tengchongensis]QKR00981.1 phosphoribosylformylglycinamidine cyclo-ligase [Metallosphaera tengchongensis]
MVSEYSKSGVDLNKVKEVHSDIASLISSTYRRTVLGAGHYSGVIDVLGKKIALHVDGVGTKTLLARKARKYRGIGKDCVAMNVNDLLCVGARPLAILDYIAMDSPDEQLVREILEGIVEGAKESDSEVIGGETAIMKDVVNGFDVACTAMGIVEELKVGNDISGGDVIIGLGSSGVHSNGYSLVRRLIDQGKLSFEEWQDQLLTPTKIYVRPVLSVMDKIKGAGHITGGSFSKLRRLTNLSMEMTLPDPPEIFKVIESAGVTHEEMHQVFNMGVGMVLFTRDSNVDEVMNVLKPFGPSWILGKVGEKPGPIKITTYKSRVLYI